MFVLKLAAPGKQPNAFMAVVMQEAAALKVFVTLIVIGANVVNELVLITLH